MKPFSPEDLILIEKLFALAAKAEVDCDLCYADGAREWCVKISSPAPTERHMTKDYGNVSIALEAGIEFLERLTLTL